jgi:hypothetical protein
MILNSMEIYILSVKCVKYFSKFVKNYYGKIWKNRKETIGIMTLVFSNIKVAKRRYLR